jgi:cellobiose-specific phosphotransferase system component IIA
MSAAVLLANRTMLNAAATLAEEVEQIMSEARAALAAAPLVVEEQRQISRHFEEGRDLDNVRIPLCHATDHLGCGWARGYYTTDVARVTCKRCLKSLAKKPKKVTR